MTDYMFQEKREEEDLPALKTALTHRYNDSKTIYKKHEGGLIRATRNKTENTMNNRMTITRKQKWEGKQLYGRFKRLINNISHRKTWTWLRKGNFKRETESLLIAAQDSALRTNYIKARIDKTQQNSKCRLCGDRDETINHIISECCKLGQREYKARHDRVGKSYSPLTNPLVTVPKAPITIGTIVTFMFRSFFNSLASSRYLSFFSHSFSFILWLAGTAKSTILQVLFFLLIIIRSGLLAD